ncbi:glycosyltransferase [Paracoccus sp. Ld10]|uniref:glycosyltransferase n=1 Tax=Paracoccus sp. Ld10 TaxID=649158 RepID=UPI00386FE7C2
MDLNGISVILPAHQEADRIGPCLRALRDQRLVPGVSHQIVVVANGCTDATAQLARDALPELTTAGWRVVVMETAVGNKIAALNMGDATATGGMRIYLDADVVVGPDMIVALHAALSGMGARYAGAKLTVPPARSLLSRAYARFWQRLPFVATGVTGAGLFAMNAEGRARWDQFPQIISDDGFARLNFAPGERSRVEIPYSWPITEGFFRLIRVRRRQDAGTAQLADLYPDLHRNASGDRPSMRGMLRIGLTDPAGFVVYAAVTVAVRLRRPSQGWDRGR